MAKRFNTAERTSRSAFTLLEVVLAIGLCGAVMALLATAIDLYLVRVDTSRTQVETAQLARVLLTQIADDLRAARFSSTSTGGTTTQSGFGTGETETGEQSTTGGGLGQQATPSLGIFGTLTEIRVDRDAKRGWRQVAVPAEEMALDSDPQEMPQTIEYFFDEGRVMPLSDFAAGGVSVDTNIAGYTGLYYRQSPTASLALSSSTTVGSGFGQSEVPAELLAPEVVQVSFMYSDGLEWFEEWDSAVQQSLPAAVEIKLTLFSDKMLADENARELDEEERRRNSANWVEYRLLVRIPAIDEPQSLSVPSGGNNSGPPQTGGQNGP